MTASRFEWLARPAGILLLALAAACRNGLPPEPPGEDPANPTAHGSPYKPPANPYETSAYTDDSPAPDHSNMHHGHAGHTMHQGAAPTSGTAPAVDHSGHGEKTTPAPKAAPHAGHQPESSQ